MFFLVRTRRFTAGSLRRPQDAMRIAFIEPLRRGSALVPFATGGRARGSRRPSRWQPMSSR